VVVQDAVPPVPGAITMINSIRAIATQAPAVN
jgi:hypothetical protein